MTIHPSLVIIIMFVAQLHVLKMICTTFCILGVRNYYKSCMDTDLIEEKSVSDLKEIISRLGGWPVVEGRDGHGIFRNDDRFNDLSFMGMQRSVWLTVSDLFSLITPQNA